MDKLTDGQTDRHKEGQAGRKTERLINRKKGKTNRWILINRQTERRTSMQVDNQTGINQTKRQTGRQTNRQTEKQAHGQTNKRLNRQVDKLIADRTDR